NATHADALGAQLVKDDAVVVRVDADAFFRVLDATPTGCVFPSGDLDNLAHFIQAYLKLPSYEPAILVGLGAGAELSASALAQSPPGTFAGAMAFDFCGSSTLRVPLCGRDGQSPHPASPTPPTAPPSAASPSTASTAAPGPASPAPAPAPPPPPLDLRRALASAEDPFITLRSSGAAACPADGSLASQTPSDGAPPLAPARDEAAFAAQFAVLATSAGSRATAAPADLDGLPIVEVPASAPGHADTFAVLLSGDGGWAGIDKEISARLARRGLPVVGIDSLRYFWRERTPESTAADVHRVIERYVAAWKRERVVLIGYSQGADVLPFVLNRLPAQSRRAVVSAVGLSLSTTATFEFHLSSWVGASGDRPTMPEVERLAHGPLLCVYGKDDAEALCPQLDPSAFRVVQLPGTHHFNGDYERVSALVLDSIPPP
ncbi:MAG TPA: AcvB/VirJ family lysyl-phosphatidylglycerol hydrolase, partial [Polyangiaceae bacterium]|nr:AcvB/VirJ family lysyl-phosphatidylglycerol hydrolase [Polyangiaceae bacterium]